MDATGDRTLAPWITLHPKMTISAEEWEGLWNPRPRQAPAQDDDDDDDDDHESDNDEDDEGVGHN
jgi:hypothetical protein